MKKKGYKVGGLRLRAAGFTLIELLIVIFIISILSLVGVNMFGEAQRVARLDYSTDSLISAVKEQWQLGRSGKREADLVGADGKSGGQDDVKGGLLCFAVKIESAKAQTGEFGSVKIAQTKYVAKDDSCEELKEENWREREVTGLNVLIADVKYEGNDQEVVSLYFKPPFGYVGWWNNSKFEKLNSGVFEINLGLLNSEMTRKVVIDIVAGEVGRERQ